jgi:hypothetical protein
MDAAPLHAIAQGIYEDMIRSHQRRDGACVMAIDGSDELPENLDRARRVR